MEKRLYRSRSNAKVFGICGGIGERFNIDPTIIRLAALLLIVFSGVGPGLFVYFLCALIIPREPMW